MIKSKQFHSISFLLLKLGVLGLLLYYLNSRLSDLPNGISFTSTIHYDALVFLIFLMPLNLFIEWQKWNVILRDETVDQKQKVHSFLSGIVSGIITPAYAGNFIGRMLYFPKSSRKKIIVNTIASNGAQFIMSISMGLVAFQIIYSSSIHVLYHLLLILANLSLYLLYFYGDSIIEKLPFRFFKQISGVVVSRDLRLTLLCLSMFRYVVFVAQFILALMVFDVPFNPDFIIWVMLMFGAITISPSLFMGKLIVRETVAITILTLIGIAVPSIILAAVSTWLLNQILPALIATLLVKKRTQHAWV
ncbi:MAG: hypothetical protein HOK92_00610 [Flavobacteriales bacterium]|nr:hypothetical protein [Flavobacteriales bacterium]